MNTCTISIYHCLCSKTGGHVGAKVKLERLQVPAIGLAHIRAKCLFDLVLESSSGGCNPVFDELDWLFFPVLLSKNRRLQLSNNQDRRLPESAQPRLPESAKTKLSNKKQQTPITRIRNFQILVISTPDFPIIWTPDFPIIKTPDYQNQHNPDYQNQQKRNYQTKNGKPQLPESEISKFS